MEYPSTWIMTGDRIGDRTVVARRLESPRREDPAGYVVLTFEDGTTERVSTLTRVTIGGRAAVCSTRRTTIVSADSGGGQWTGEAWEDRQQSMRDFARELADKVTERSQS